MLPFIQIKNSLLAFSFSVAISIILSSCCCSPENTSTAYPEKLAITEVSATPVRIITTANNINLTELWRISTAGHATSPYPNIPNFPIVAGRKVIMGSAVGENDNVSVRLVALSIESGQVLWRTRWENPKTGNYIRSTLADNERLYLVSSFQVHAFSLDTGLLSWSTPVLAGHTGYWFRPGESDDPLLLHSSSNEIFAIDPTTGAIKSKQPDDPAWFRVGQIEFVVASNGLFAYEQPGEHLLWSRLEKQPYNRQLQQWPSIIGDDIIFESGAPCFNIVRLNVRTGKILWETPERNFLSNFVIHDSEVYALREDLSLVALDINTGSITGTLQFSDPPAQTICKKSGSDVYWVVTKNDMIFVYFGDSKELIALQKRNTQ